MNTKIYVVATNCGDGSVSLTFYDDIKVAEFHDSADEEGFAESTVTTLDIESDGPVKIKNLTNSFQYYLSLIERDNPDAAEFKEKFGHQFPEFTLKLNTTYVDNTYQYVDVFVEDKKIFAFFVKKKMSIKTLRNHINGL